MKGLRRSMRWFCAALLTVCAGCAVYPPPDTTASGLVLDPQGKPVIGATVQPMPFPGEARKTGRDGSFKVSWSRIRGPTTDDPGYLLVRAPDAQLAAFFSLNGYEKLEGLRITLAPGIAITGAVQDPDKRPIPNAQVEVNLVRSISIPLGRAFCTCSVQEGLVIDKYGRFDLSALPADEQYTVAARAAGFGRAK